MPIAFTERAETPSTSNAQTYASGSYTPTANTGLIACCAGSGTVTSAALGSGNGLTWTREGDQARGTAAIVHMFSALTGASPTTTGFTIDYTAADPGTGAGITVVECSGIDLTDFVVNMAKNTGGTAGTPSVTFSPGTAPDCAIIAMAIDVTVNPAAITPPANYVETTDSGWATPATGWEVAWHVSPGSITTLTWGSATAGAWAAMALELRPLPIQVPSLVTVVGTGSAV